MALQHAWFGLEKKMLTQGRSRDLSKRSVTERDNEHDRACGQLCLLDYLDGFPREHRFIEKIAGCYL